MILIETTKEFTTLYKEKRKEFTLRTSKRGLSSFYVMEEKEKYTNKQCCKYWKSPGGEENWTLPGNAARQTLQFFNNPVGRISNAQFNLRLSAPMLYIGKYINRDLVYFDIVSCYYQIYRKLWTDTKWPKGQGKDSLLNSANYLEDWKQARNAVPGLMYSRSFKVLTPNNDFIRYSKNPYFNPALWVTINHFLHELSNIAISCNVCYVATDGFVFPVNADWKKFESVIIDIGLEYRKITGSGNIFNWMAYNIEGIDQNGERATKATKPASRYLVDNPVEKKQSEIDRMIKRMSFRIDKIKKLNLTSVTDECIIRWWMNLRKGT